MSRRLMLRWTWYGSSLLIAGGEMKPSIRTGPSDELTGISPLASSGPYRPTIVSRLLEDRWVVIRPRRFSNNRNPIPGLARAIRSTTPYR